MNLGVDAGGTSTRAVLVDDRGECLGYGAAGGGNPVSWGAQQAAAEIRGAVSAALRQAADDDAPGRRVTGTVALALAGGSSTAASEAVSRALRPLGVEGPIVVESDLLATFCAGTHHADGYAVVSGTGAAAIRVRGGRVAASADGLGWLLGDDGSGFWIGQQAVRAALAALEGRGPATALSGLVISQLDLADDGRYDANGRPAVVQQVVNALYRARPVELSRFAAAAFEAVGDPVARNILDHARALLVASLRAVRRAEVTGPIVLGGGVARRLPGLAQALAAAAGGDGVPRAQAVIVPDGTVGAAVLALRHAGVDVDETVFRHLNDSIARRRAE